MVGFSGCVWQVKNTTHQSKADALPIHVIRECWWFRACNLRVVIFLALLGSPGGSAFASSIVATNGNTFLGIFIEHGNNANRRITAIASRSEAQTSAPQSLMPISHAVFCSKKHNSKHTLHIII